jgi:hypothetical protein
LLTAKDKHELDILHWGYINPVTLDDQDREKVRAVFAKMKAEGTRCTVDDLYDYLSTKPKERNFSDSALKQITEIARDYFIIG